MLYRLAFEHMEGITNSRMMATTTATKIPTPLLLLLLGVDCCVLVVVDGLLAVDTLLPLPTILVCPLPFEVFCPPAVPLL